MNVFISHDIADRAAAERLAAALKAEGFSVTNPAEIVGPGDNMALKVGKALEQATAMVALLSPKAAKSEWVQHEIGYALTSPQFQGRLIPVMVKPTANIPWILHELQVLRGISSVPELARRIGSRLRPVPKGSSVRIRRVAPPESAVAGA